MPLTRTHSALMSGFNPQLVAAKPGASTGDELRG